MPFGVCLYPARLFTVPMLVHIQAYRTFMAIRLHTHCELLSNEYLPRLYEPGKSAHTRTGDRWYSLLLTAFLLAVYSFLFLFFGLSITHTHETVYASHIVKWRDPGRHERRMNPKLCFAYLHIAHQISISIYWYILLYDTSEFGHFFDSNSFCMQIIRMELINPPTLTHTHTHARARDHRWITSFVWCAMHWS